MNPCQQDSVSTNIDVLNDNQIILENEREEKEKNKQEETSYPSIETSIEAIVQAIAQVSLRDEEIKSLKTENQRMDEIVKKKEEDFFF